MRGHYLSNLYRVLPQEKGMIFFAPNNNCLSYPEKNLIWTLGLFYVKYKIYKDRYSLM